ncbi:sigma-54-dependent transcriptional regulator [Thiomicrorhabdus aquaedulcis]|uniref:sigma-54-dependent transcriptional regulator n=1 Tax=Thiomicrorhabdus aquaedulcis TaxID=2211106 RepID=UPI000FDC8A64|nr:sigma-54 dependent transcriptional regulator [Thiomicrorhabdus aquaedulcis]
MKPGKLLIVDDEKDIRNLMKEIFIEEGYQVETAANGAQARTAWRKQLPDVVFLDVWMPDIDGISLLKELRKDELLEHTNVIMMSGHGTIETAIEATKLGAYDFLEKPLSMAKLIVTAERALEHHRLNQENRLLKQKLPDQFLPIGKSKLMQELRDTIERLAKFSMPVFVSGDPGTGKHHFAHALHKTSERHAHAFISLNAQELNSLIEPEKDSELAVHNAGRTSLETQLREAHNGTLAIANVEKLSRPAQKWLMEIITTQTARLPSHPEPTVLNLRIIGISRKSLDVLAMPTDVDLSIPSRFKEDLLQRFKVMPIHIPALRQHTEDIPDLIDYFVNEFVTREGLEYRQFTVGAQNLLRQYAWPGNLKELQNLIQRLLILGHNEVIDDEIKAALTQVEHSSQQMAALDTSVNLKEAKDRLEAAYLSQLLRETAGNVSETAKRSGIDRTNLYRKLKALGIDPKNPI